MVRDINGRYSETLYSDERRQAERTPVAQVRAHCQSYRGEAICDIEDISPGGARMRAVLPVGTEVDVELYLSKWQSIRTTARVVHSLFPQRSVGLVFDDLDEQDRALIRELIARAEVEELVD